MDNWDLNGLTCGPVPSPFGSCGRDSSGIEAQGVKKRQPKQRQDNLRWLQTSVESHPLADVKSITYAWA
jgi:hypothetical protein